MPNKILLVLGLVLGFVGCVPEVIEPEPLPSTGGNTDSTIVTYHEEEYPIVWIGPQCWFAKDLKTTKYSNGDNIPYRDIFSWNTASNFQSLPGYTVNDCEYITWDIGYHYNWWAVADERNICPEGWRVPTKNDLEFLVQQTGGEDLSGYSLRDTLGWNPPEQGTNQYGFNMNPNYIRDDNYWTSGNTGESFSFYDIGSWVNGFEHDPEDYDEHSFWLWGVETLGNNPDYIIGPTYLNSDWIYTGVGTNFSEGHGMCVRCIKE